MKATVFSTALAIALAGACSLGAEEDSWGAFLRRCDGGGPRRVVSKKQSESLREAFRRAPEATRRRIAARVHRLNLLAQAFRSAREMAAKRDAARRVTAMLFPTIEAPTVDLRKVMEIWLRLNGIETGRTLGRKTKMMV